MDLDVWTCRNCGREVATKLSRCPRCQFDKAGHAQRPAEAPPAVEWDSPSSRAIYTIASRPPRQRDELSPWGYVGIGVAIAFVGGLVSGISHSEGGLLAGLLLVGVGSLLSSIGTIALGVRIGMSAWQDSVEAHIRVSRSDR